MSLAPRLALQTKEAIDAAIYSDQGRMFRKYLREVILDVDDAFDSSHHDRFRSHMGISTSGRECARELFYKWRWAVQTKVSGRMLRLFNRGHLEEARFAAMLMTIGCQLWREEAPGKQFRVSYFGGHYGSAIDGVVQGIPEMPEEAMLTEFKTHGSKSFKKLAGELDSEGNYIKPPQGVQVAKNEHYVQMQQYMGYYKLRFGLYGAVNKDTDELYWEIVEYDPAVDEACKERSRRIIFAKEIPPKISENVSFWMCKYCDVRRICHYGDAPDFNCRTCAAAQPREDGNWYCSTHETVIDKTRQLSGCPDWQHHHLLMEQKK